MSEPVEDFVESGPYCSHWSDPGDCEEKCATCGHTCRQHYGGYIECQAEGCSCKEFKDEVAP